MTMTSYQERRNAENLACQDPHLQVAAKDILEELKRIERVLYWAIDPEETDGGAQWARSLIEHAHALLDLAHDYRQALKAYPSPKIPEENDE